MDNFGGIAILVLIWIVGAVFDKKKKEERRRRQMAQQSLPPSIEVESVSAEPRSQLPDASQSEGSKLEQVLRQLNPELAVLADQALAQSRQQTATKPEAEVRSVTVRSPVDPIVASEDTGDFMAKAERAIARRRLARKNGLSCFCFRKSAAQLQPRWRVSPPRPHPSSRRSSGVRFWGRRGR